MLSFFNKLQESFMPPTFIFHRGLFFFMYCENPRAFIIRSHPFTSLVFPEIPQDHQGRWGGEQTLSRTSPPPHVHVDEADSHLLHHQQLAMFLGWCESVKAGGRSPAVHSIPTSRTSQHFNTSTSTHTRPPPLPHGRRDGLALSPSPRSI